MKMTLTRKILAGFIACTIVLFVVAIFSFRNSQRFIDASKWVTHTHEVMYEFDLVLASTLDAESAVRGFVITNDGSFLDVYNTARLNANDHLENVKNLTTDNTAQQRNIELLRKQIDLRMKHLDDEIAFRRQSFEKATTFIQLGEGKRMEGEIRRIVSVCRNIEIELLAQRKTDSEKDAKDFATVFIILLAVILLVLGVVYFLITTNLRQIKKLEKEN